MCSSFTDGAAAAVLSAGTAPGAPRVRASVLRSGNGELDYHDRLARDRGRGLEGGRRRPRGHRRRRAPRCHQRRGALRPRIARVLPRRRGRCRPPWPVTPTWAGGACASTRAVASWPGAIPLGRHRHLPDRRARGPAAGDRHGPPGARAAAGRRGEHRRDHVREGHRPRRRARPRANLSRMPGAVVTGWGIAVPDKVVTNEDLSARLDTSDQWIAERTGIRERRIGGTTAELAIGGRARRPWPARRAHRRRRRRARARHLDPRRPRARHLGHGPGRPGRARRCLRRQRGVFGVRLRARRRPRPRPGRRPASARHRQRDAVADHRLGRPQHRRPGRRRRRCGGARGHRRARASCWPGTSGPTGRCATFSSATTAATST